MICDVQPGWILVGIQVAFLAKIQLSNFLVVVDCFKEDYVYL